MRAHRKTAAGLTTRRLGPWDRHRRAVFVGKPTLWSNPFQRPGIGQARSAILYKAWIAGELTPHIFRCARFSDAEIAALDRWRSTLVARLPALTGRHLRCNCPGNAKWCHADILLKIADGGVL